MKQSKKMEFKFILYNPSIGKRRVIHVPTRARTPRESCNKIMSLSRYIKMKNLSPGELEERIAKIKYSRDYSFLVCEDGDHPPLSSSLVSLKKLTIDAEERKTSAGTKKIARVFKVGAQRQRKILSSRSGKRKGSRF